MLYPFKYDLSATSGYFCLTMSSNVAYYQYEPVDLNKLVIPFKKKPETSS
ncbi:hypothetical protein [Methanosarcina barkeri]|nr:hypothetical protein [Methanosarcina barkeri]